MVCEVAIPTYKRPDKLCRLVRSLLINRGDIIITIMPDNSGKKAFKLLNEASERSNADIFLPMSDDTEFMPDVIEKVCNAMAEYFPDLDGVISMKWLNIPTVTYGAIAFCGRKFRERFPNKWIFCPDYVSLYADAELGKAAESLGKLKVIEGTGINHYHPAHYPEMADEAHYKNRETQSKDDYTRQRRQDLGYIWGLDFNVIY